MEFTEPSSKNYTIYSKSGCLNCNKVKNLLKEKNLIFFVVDCDEYLIENKNDFLFFIKEKTNKEVKTFPMVFDNGKFIGGYSETQDYIDKSTLSFEDY